MALLIPQSSDSRWTKEGAKNVNSSVCVKEKKKTLEIGDQLEKMSTTMVT